ncbi:RNA polymerase sigma-70 factor [Fulvivirga ligni]|uniref:RNA polymerase sigma-70 factor n=1 Tax=Fulvivirga ligni TaxID=2904246 RepID=UPI001F23802B|nr:RNA polymerase sigma-70 factor [Fulvivirga ligni]UII19005.1 RNA polymerase sigma-70 factor [Fulvivirga ligni]
MNTSSLKLNEFKELFKSLYPSLCFFANSYLKDEADSQDVVQEIFLKVWENEVQFIHKNAAKSYLYNAVKNRCLDILSSSRMKALDDRVPIESIENVFSDSFFYKEVIIIETSEVISQALDSLPKKCQEIINLSLKKYTNQEIASKLSLSINTVKAQKKIAYKKLRPLLKQYYHSLFE